MTVAPAILQPTLFFFSTIFIFVRLVHSMSEAQALVNFKASISNSQALKNWVVNTVPCKEGEEWDGVICNGGFISGIRLEGMGLSGKIDVNPLLEIKGLRTFSIINNYFSGTIPEINRIGFLKAVYLSGNQFSGEIPSDFFQKMRSLKKLWLNDNQFTGQIPLQIPALVELHLENNQFSGNLLNPSRTVLVEFNVSNNKLEGEIPSSLSKFSASSFSGNPGLCGEKLNKPCQNSVESPKARDNTEQNKDSDASDSNSSSKSSSTVKIAAIVVASVVVLLTLLALLYVRSRRKKKEKGILGSVRSENDNEESSESVEVQVAAPEKKEETSISRKSSRNGSSRKGAGRGGGSGCSGVGELVMVNNERGVLGMMDLMKAAAEVLGSGGFGSSYKAVMTDGFAVVVKRIREREVNVLGKDGFDAEMRKLGSLKHKNILTPLAYHYRKDERLVVSEYVPKGSLLYLLHGETLFPPPPPGF